MPIEQLLNHEKVGTKNLKFRTDLGHQVMDGWSVTQSMIVYKGRLLKKIFRLKIKACPVKAGHYMAFKHLVSFATNLAANFGCNLFRITPDIVGFPAFVCHHLKSLCCSIRI